MDSDVSDYSEHASDIRPQYCFAVNLYSEGVHHGRESKGTHTFKQYCLYLPSSN